MAIQDKYKYGDLKWKDKQWEIGEIISKEKAQNINDGIKISIAILDDILTEISMLDPAAVGPIITTGTRVDNIQKWITGTDDGTYGTNLGSIATRLLSCETYISTFEGYDIDNRLNVLETAKTANDKFITAVTNEIGGTYDAGTGFTNSKIDSIISEIGGWNNNTFGTTRIDDLQQWITGAVNGNYDKTSISSATCIIGRLSSLETAKTNYNSRIGTLETNEKQLRNYITGSDTGIYTNNNSINDRIDDIDKFVKATKTEFGGTYIENTGFTDSRVDKLNLWITGQKDPTTAQEYSGTAISTRLNILEDAKDDIITAIAGSGGTLIPSTNVYGRLDTLETFMTATKTKIGDWDTSSFGNGTCLDIVINEVWGGNNGTNTTFDDDSRIDNIQKWITGSISGNYSKNITETAGWIDKRLTYLEDNISPDSVETLRTSLTQARRVLSDSPATINGYTGEGLIHRMNQVEGAIAVIAHDTGIPTIMIETASVDTTTLEGYEILNVNSPLLEYQICFIIIKHTVSGNGKLKVKYNDGKVLDVYYKDQADCQMQIPIPLNTILGVYRKPETNNLYLFNAPTIL